MGQLDIRRHEIHPRQHGWMLTVLAAVMCAMLGAVISQAAPSILACHELNRARSLYADDSVLSCAWRGTTHRLTLQLYR